MNKLPASITIFFGKTTRQRWIGVFIADNFLHKKAVKVAQVNQPQSQMYGQLFNSIIRKNKLVSVDLSGDEAFGPDEGCP